MAGGRYDAGGVCLRINLVVARTGFFGAGHVEQDMWSWTCGVGLQAMKILSVCGLHLLASLASFAQAANIL
jgi:hypothetical protein